MDFNLKEDQIILGATARDFTEREIEPIAAQIDREGKLPDDLIRKMGKIGLLGMTVTEQYGGTGAGNLSTVLACEQVAYSGTGAWWLLGFNNSIPACISHFGSKELKRKYIRPLCEGNAYASIQFTEDETGSNPEALVTTAVPDGDYFIINGMKRFSTFGARDGYAILYAKDDTGKCSAFLIEKNCQGYEASKVWELMGGGGIETVDVYLRNLRIPKGNLLGGKGKGFDILLHWIAIEKVQQCAVCVGIAQAALDEAIRYARLRTVKGKSISNMQGIQWILAEMQSKLEAARLLTYRAAFLSDRKAVDWMIEAAAAKLFVVPTAMEVTEKARQIHGGYGYTKEFKIERLSRAIAGAGSIATSLEINRSIVGSSLVNRESYLSSPQLSKSA